MYSKLNVLSCGHGYGYYLGRTSIDPETGLEGKGTRESEYYLSPRGVIKAVQDGLTLRSPCDENMVLYAKGLINTCPGTLYQDKEFWKE